MKKLLSLVFFVSVVAFGFLVPQSDAFACSSGDGQLYMPSSLGTLTPGKSVDFQLKFQWNLGSAPVDCADIDLTAQFYVGQFSGAKYSYQFFVGSTHIGKVAQSIPGNVVIKTISVSLPADKLIEKSKSLGDSVGEGKLFGVIVGGLLSEEYSNVPSPTSFRYLTDSAIWACVDKNQTYKCYAEPPFTHDPQGTKDLCEHTVGCRAEDSPKQPCQVIPDKNKCNTVAVINTPPPGSTPTPTSTSGGTGGTTSKDISVNLDIRNPLAISDVNELISKVQEWLIKFSIPVGVILIIYAGILLIFSRGNSAQITKARQIIQGVALGLAIIFIGSGFVSLVESILELGGPAGTPGPSTTYDPGNGTCRCEPGAGVCLSQQCKSGTYCFAIDGVGQCKVPSQDPYEGDDCSVNACPGGYTCSSFGFCHRILP